MHSPCRTPVPAQKRTTALTGSGNAVVSASTCSVVSGTTLSLDLR
jgi:hypothetical protein